MRNGLVALTLAAVPSVALADESRETDVEIVGYVASDEKSPALRYNLDVVAGQEILGYNVVVSVRENACGSKPLKVERHSVAY
ncbi:MAG: hypothetical protein AABX82_04240, partial [Nanoarchaeota archaeon]